MDGKSAGNVNPTTCRDYMSNPRIDIWASIIFTFNTPTNYTASTMERNNESTRGLRLLALGKVWIRSESGY